MSLPKFEYAEPRSLKRACQMLQQRGGRARVIAGGTELLPALKYRLQEPDLLVDLQKVPSLKRIHYSPTHGLVIGASVTLRHLAEDTVVKEKYPSLVQALSQVGTVQLQTMGTVGGNLLQDNLCLYYNRPPMLRLPLDPCLKLGGVVCHAVSGSQECWAVYSGDLAPVLLVLGASVTIASSDGTRTVPVIEIFSGDGKQPNRLQPGEVLTEIRIPPPGSHSGSVYLKMRRRKTIDYPLLGVAVQVDLEPGSGICRDLSLAMTAVGQAPLVVRETENLRGRRIASEEIEALAQAAFKHARPLSNVSEVTPKYRREMVKVYVRMAARQALDRAMEKGAHV